MKHRFLKRKGIYKKSCLFLLAVALNSVHASHAGPRQDVAKDAATKWSDCVINQGLKWVKSTEPADTISKAAFGRCVSQEASFRTAFARVYSDPLRFESTPDNATVEQQISNVRQAIGEKLIAAILDARTPQ